MVFVQSNPCGRKVRQGTKALIVSAMATSSLALLHPANAQQPTPSPPANQEAQTAPVEEIVVTGSLIVRDGYEAPTPVTVVGIEEIQQTAPTSIADYINSLPAMAGGSSAHQAGGGISFSTKGANTVNLRGLGNSRTLVLLDGKRFPPVSFDGTVDVGGIPESLVQRVDVVTGGASAAYGSDAVAGVVNFILNTKFTGIKGEVQGGVTTYGDDRSYNLKLTAGFPFAGGRGHVLLSGDLAYLDGAFGAPRPWQKSGWIGMANPAYTSTNGQPQFLITGGVGNSRQTYGGIINSGPLKGIYFGPGGVPAMLNLGSINNGTYMVGGDWQYTNFQTETGLDNRNTRQGLYFRASYDVADELEAYVEANYSNSNVLVRCCYNFTSTSLTIKADNAFIPATVAAQMAALKLTTLTIGTENGDLGPVFSSIERAFNRYRLGLSGKIDAFGDTWSWDAYGQSGYSRADTHLPGAYIRAKYAQAYDAVRNPATGAIVCRSTLTSPSDGCVPFNIMGQGVNSQAAINYVTGEAYLYQPYVQSGAGGSVRGEPFSNWEGPISVAFGADYRHDGVKGIVDPLSPGAGYFAGNYQVTKGSFNVIEGFGEAVIPLAKDRVWAKQLDMNAAVRGVSYSQAGYVTTWKLGLTYNPIDDLRLRMTRSRDIRAPNLQELFSGGGAAAVTIIDPFRNNANYGSSIGTVGNTNLTPEKADTIGLGAVYQPSWFGGFSASFDYYDIENHDVISTVGWQPSIDRCYGGETQFCSAIIRDPSSGLITLIRSQPFNFAAEHTKGFDVEATYRTSLADLFSSWSGDLTLRALATHVISDRTDDGAGNIIEKAGANSGAGPLKWRATLLAVYTVDALTVGVTERIISAGVYNNSYVLCTSGCPVSTANHQTVSYNHIDGASYTDLNLTYKFGEGGGTQAFLSIQNLFDRDPPPVAAAQYAMPANSSFYDVLGRQFRLGIRFSM